MVSVTNIEVSNLGVELPDKLKKYKSLVPTTLIPEKCSFHISGVSNALANGIRRVLGAELLVSHLDVDINDIITNDRRIIPAMLVERIKQIPIHQSTPLDATFEINISNSTPVYSVVYTRDFKIIAKGSASKAEGCAKYAKISPINKLPFNETTQFCDLQPTCSLIIKNIIVKQHYGYDANYMMCRAGISPIAVAIDQRPTDIYASNDQGGTPSGISNPRQWKIQFITNGIIDARSLMLAACDKLIERIENVMIRVDTITRDNSGVYLLTIPNDSDTIGNLYVRTCCDLFDSNIDAIVYDVPTVGRNCVIKLKLSDTASGELADPYHIYKTISSHITQSIKSIRAAFE